VAQQTPHPVLIRRPLASIGKPHFKSTGLPVALACHADPAKLSCKASHHPHVLMCVRVKIDFRDCAHEAVQTFRFFLPFFLSFFLSLRLGTILGSALHTSPTLCSIYANARAHHRHHHLSHLVFVSPGHVRDLFRPGHIRLDVSVTSPVTE